MHIHQQQVAALELWIHKRVVIRDDRRVHLQRAPTAVVNPFQAMRSRRHEQLAALGIEVGCRNDGEQPIHRRSHRPPALVIIVLRDARAARGAVVDDESGQDRIVVEQAPRGIQNGRVTGNEAEIRIRHAALGQRVAARCRVFAGQRSVQRWVAAERGFEALNLGVVQRAANNQVAVA